MSGVMNTAEQTPANQHRAQGGVTLDRQVSFWISEAEANEVDAIARQLDRSSSYVYRWGIRQFLASTRHQPNNGGAA